LRGRGDFRPSGAKSLRKTAPSVPPAPADSDRRDALRLVPVSRETERRFEIYVALLDRWRKITNLISDASFGRVWTRHIADSAQLLGLAPGARNWVDLGSGAGFPGLVVAMQLAETPGSCVHLIESDRRKCAFLREVARQTGSPAQVHALRAEAPEAQDLTPVDAVTARAFAPLPQLMELAKVFMARGAVGVFPRGRTLDAQIAEMSAISAFHIETKPSKLDPSAAILIVRESVPR
jgi:16S rRNA (guanine527-N7)-methyltransferase